MKRGDLFWVSDPLCFTPSSALHFFQLFFLCPTPCQPGWPAYPCTCTWPLTSQSHGSILKDNKKHGKTEPFVWLFKGKSYLYVWKYVKICAKNVAMLVSEAEAFQLFICEACLPSVHLFFSKFLKELWCPFFFFFSQGPSFLGKEIT
jgi:hypothetical protein